ncbi:MAG TPA: hypothetical protein VH250_12860 [Granulicella sp.]|nr:hypothetical protein [Granulicella sp.]
MVKIAFALSLVLSASALAQQVSTSQPSPEIAAVSDLPDAPSFQNAQSAPSLQNAAAMPEANARDARKLEGMMGLPAAWTSTPLTLNQKFKLYEHQTFGPHALILPLFGAGIRMAHPPTSYPGYPKQWTDGAGAFGRLYGSALATQSTKRTARFLVDAAVHEDPRYQSAPLGANTAVRFVHAIAFTFVDRSDSGHSELAYGNFASAAAGGFVGMAYLPAGYNDASHAGERMGTEFLGLAVQNVAREFAPQWVPIARKLHIPKILPGWWTSGPR